jgi:hypothetical protein
MVSWLAREFNQQEWVSSNRIFTEGVHFGDIWAPGVNVFQNGCQFFVVVVLELQSCLNDCRGNQDDTKNKRHQS